MVLVNKNYANQLKHIQTGKQQNNEAEMTLVKLTPYRKPRYSSCYIASIYIPPVAAQNYNRRAINRRK